MNLIENLNWRYAVKKYKNEEVSEEKINNILHAINLSASSCGLQPYRIFAISNQELKAKLGTNSFNGQITESSHLLVFATYNKVTTQHIQNYINLTAETKKTPVSTLNDFFTVLDSYFKSRTDEENKFWAEKQTYIALGTALIAAANEKVDATPMEGFDATLFDELLNLKEKDLHTAVILSVGYRDQENDYLANSKKVRIPLSEMVTEIK